MVPQPLNPRGQGAELSAALGRPIVKALAAWKLMPAAGALYLGALELQPKFPVELALWKTRSLRCRWLGVRSRPAPEAGGCSRVRIRRSNGG